MEYFVWDPLAKEVARIGRMLGIAVVIIAVVVMGTLFALSDDPAGWRA